MRLESVRDIKLEAKDVLRDLILEGGGAALAGPPAIATRRARGPARGIALGITTADEPEGFRLAVRIQGRALEHDYKALAKLTDLSQGELDVANIGPVRPLWQRGRHRPLRIGSSVAHHEITAGTIGAFPRRRSDGQRVLLSNAHVLALEGLAAVGDSILQPGPYDGGLVRHDRIGGLLEWAPFVPDGDNRVDAAICEVAEDFEKTELFGFGTLLGARPHPADPGEAVSKIGRTTGLTRGRVTAIELDDLIVDMEEVGAVRFNGQIEIEGTRTTAFSDGGDSGSLILDADGWAIGLLFAGSDRGGVHGLGLTYANDIQTVLAVLDLELDV